MKIVKTKRPPMSTNITFRLQNESLKKIAEIAKENKVSRQLVVNRLIEKALNSKNFSIEI